MKQMLCPMNKELINNHIGDQVTDFVLDLLAPEDRHFLAMHLKQCSRCRQLVAVEERIGLLVRSTVEASGQSQAKLSILMPQAPAKHAGLFSRASVRQQFAFAGLALIVFLAGFNLMFRQELHGSTAPVATTFIATASYTQTPTEATSSPTPKTHQQESTARPATDQLFSSPLITPAPPAVNAR
jgi:hypothetical protein